MLLQPGDQLEKIAGLLDELTLVALAFPAFSDGRSFSKAELLRSRHHFEGAGPRHRPGAGRPVAAYAAARLRRVRGLASGADRSGWKQGSTGGIAALLPADRQAGGQRPEIFLAAHARAAEAAATLRSSTVKSIWSDQLCDLRFSFSVLPTRIGPLFRDPK